MNLLIATHNRAKFIEIKNNFQSSDKLKVNILSLKDLGVKKQLQETGKTFCQNALLKAKFYGDLTGLAAVGDDGGLIIPALNNEPGVKSRRWLGREADDEELINYTLNQLKNKPKEKRSAYLNVCLCFYNPETKEFFSEEEKIKGHIAEKPSKKRIKGYPFRSLFIVDKLDKYYDELTKKEHDQINHRLKALKRLARRIKLMLK